MFRFRDAIEDTYDDVTSEYYDSDEYKELEEEAESIYQELQQKPDNWKELLGKYRQAMMVLAGSMASNSYVIGVYAGMAELQEFNSKQ